MAMAGPVVQKHETGGSIAPLIVRLGCEASGSPREFPDDVRIVNLGAASIPAGRTISWEMTSPDYKKSFVLSRALAPGASIHSMGVIPGGIQAGKACKAKLI